MTVLGIIRVANVRYTPRDCGIGSASYSRSCFGLGKRMFLLAAVVLSRVCKRLNLVRIGLVSGRLSV